MPKFWLSYHIACHESVYGVNFNGFLLNLIKPAIDYLMKENLITKFFFIRYAEKGPHTRLRLEINPENEEKVKDIVFFMTNEYFKKKESYADKKMSIMIPKKYQSKLYSNGSVNNEKYVRELERFGGEYGISVVEDEFFNSSKLVLNLMPYIHQQSREKNMFLAAFFLMEYLNVFFKNDDEKIVFLKNYARASLDAEAGDIASTLWEKDQELLNFLSSNQQKTLPRFVQMYYNAFQYMYNNNKKPIELNILSGINNVHFNHDQDNIIRQWKISLKHNISNMVDLAKNDVLEISKYLSLTPEKKVISIIASLIHLHNNRLGLHLIDEAWLAYILGNTLSKEGR